MPKVENNNINIYGLTIVNVTTLKVYAYKGKYIFNKSTGKYVVAPDVTVGAAHELVAVAIPNSTNKIGYEITLPSNLPNGKHDLVYLDALVYAGGIRILKKDSGEIIDITNKSEV